MDATCAIQDSIHVFSLVHKYVSRILGTSHRGFFMPFFDEWLEFQAGISKKTNENSI